MSLKGFARVGAVREMTGIYFQSERAHWDVERAV